MATLEQLPADQRAIIELVLMRGRSYDALSDMLDMPASRVRELARDALVELAPHTSQRVDADWRAQVADYALGQQSGPESAATEGHLRRSEAARAWLGSLMDSLDKLYTDESRPPLPQVDGERSRERARARREPSAASASGNGAGAADAARSGTMLSPAARSAVQRRRLIGGVAALVVLVVAVLLLTDSFPGQGDDGGGESQAGGETPGATPANQQPTELIGELPLAPVGRAGDDVAGVGAIAKTGNQFQFAVQAKLPPTGENAAYEVWLYNSRDDAVSIGAQRTDAEGNYEGAGPIPADYAKYKYIDVSRERIDRNPEHSGRSLLRGEIAELRPPQQGEGGVGGQPQP